MLCLLFYGLIFTSLCVSDPCAYFANPYSEVPGEQKIYTISLDKQGALSSYRVFRSFTTHIADISGFGDRLWAMNAIFGIEYQLEEGPNPQRGFGFPSNEYNISSVRSQCEPIALSGTGRQETAAYFICEGTQYWYLCNNFKDPKCDNTAIIVEEDVRGFITNTEVQGGLGFIFATENITRTISVDKDGNFDNTITDADFTDEGLQIRAVVQTGGSIYVCLTGPNGDFLRDITKNITFSTDLTDCTSITAETHSAVDYIYIASKKTITSYVVDDTNSKLEEIAFLTIETDHDLTLAAVADCETFPIVIAFEATSGFTDENVTSLISAIAKLFPDQQESSFERVIFRTGALKRQITDYVLQINLNGITQPPIDEFYRTTCEEIFDGAATFLAIGVTLNECDNTGEASANPGESPPADSPTIATTIQPTSTSSPQSPAQEETPSNNSSLYIIIGLVIALVFILLVVLLVVLFLYFKQHNKNTMPQKKDSSRYKTMDAKESSSSEELKERKVASVETHTEDLDNDQYARVETHITGGTIQEPGITREPSRPMALSTLVAKNWFLDYSELQLGKKLGAGSFGIVRKATWRFNDVAVKFCSDVSGVDEFIAEVKLMVEMRPHNNVVRVFGVCKNESTMSYLVVMDFMAGGSLDTLLFESDVSLSLEEKKSIIIGTAKGLHHLHQEGIIHRDLAARNVLLDERNVPKISDFGMSRTLQEQQSKGATRNTTGPIKWMAPENMRREYSKSSDVWSFACLLFEIFHEQPPWRDRNDLLQLALDIREKGATPPVNEECTPVKYRSLMKACWSFTPEDRPPMAEICTQLLLPK